jgi:uncharacterized repeat protein (TIGR03803 family)
MPKLWISCFVQTVFSLAAIFMVHPMAIAQHETVVHSFAENNGIDGNEPLAGLILDAEGNLYGTTAGGGANTECLQIGCGTAFKLSPVGDGTWTETILHSFDQNGVDGFFPSSSLVFDSAGNLYGVTNFGGANGYGTVFEISPGAGGTWSEKVIYSFNDNGMDGFNPWSALVIGPGGRLYGTTPYGGLYYSGTVYELTPHADGKWTEEVLHSFGGATDGSFSWGSVILDKAGNVYGTAETGGSDLNCLGDLGCGIVFELSKVKGQWEEDILHVFPGHGGQGASPAAGLIMDSAGDLFGTTCFGGPYVGGTVFKLSAEKGIWKETVLKNFNGADGDSLYAGVIFDDSGNLYGAAMFGGTNNFGLAYELSATDRGTWVRSILHQFVGGTDGAKPEGNLVRNSAGELFGTTMSGGASSGTVFEITPR